MSELVGIIERLVACVITVGDHLVLHAAQVSCHIDSVISMESNNSSANLDPDALRGHLILQSCIRVETNLKSVLISCKNATAANI